MILTCPNCSSRFRVSQDDLGMKGRKVRCSSCHESWFQNPEETSQIIKGEITKGEITKADDDDFSTILENLIGQQEEADASEWVEVGADGFAEENGQNADLQDEPEEVDEFAALLGQPQTAPPPLTQFERRDFSQRNAGYIAACVIFLLSFCLVLVAGKSVMQAYPQAYAFYGLFGMETDLAGKNLVFNKIEAVGGGEKGIHVRGNIENLGKAEQEIPFVEASLLGKGGDILERWIIAPPANTIKAEGSLSFDSTYHSPKTKPEESENIHLRFVLLSKADIAKTGAGDGGNTQAPPADAQAHPNAHEEVSESPPPSSSAPHPAPSQ